MNDQSKFEAGYDLGFNEGYEVGYTEGRTEVLEEVRFDRTKLVQIGELVNRLIPLLDLDMKNSEDVKTLSLLAGRPVGNEALSK